MTVINLLPWREESRKENKKNFLILLIIVISVTLLFCVLFHIFLNIKLARQQNIMQIWESEYAKENTKMAALRVIKKDRLSLLQNIKYLYELRENNYLIVRLMNELAKVVPDTIVLTSIQRDKNVFMVSGVANSSLQVTTFMDNLAKIPFFYKANITNIVSKDSDPEVTEKRIFKLTFQPLAKG